MGADASGFAQMSCERAQATTSHVWLDQKNTVLYR